MASISRVLVDLQKLVQEYGVDNIVFLTKVRPLRQVMGIVFTTSNDPQFEVPCRISEERYKLKDNYKVTLVPIYEGFEKRHYYVSDLELMISRGDVRVLVNPFYNR